MKRMVKRDVVVGSERGLCDGMCGLETDDLACPISAIFRNEAPEQCEAIETPTFLSQPIIVRERVERRATLRFEKSAVQSSIRKHCSPEYASRPDSQRGDDQNTSPADLT